MKNIVTITALVLSLVPFLAQADATSSVKDNVLNRVRALNPEVRQELKDAKEEVREVRKENREERKQLRNDIKKKLWSERVGIARARIGVIRAHVTRLENVANRLLQVATQRESEGVSVTDARAKIASSTAQLADAKTQLEGIIAQFPTEQTASTTPKATISAIAKSLNSVVTLIKGAHQDLIDAWQILKPLKMEKENATSTASST